MGGLAERRSLEGRRDPTPNKIEPPKSSYRRRAAAAHTLNFSSKILKIPSPETFHDRAPIPTERAGATRSPTRVLYIINGEMEISKVPHFPINGNKALKCIPLKVAFFSVKLSRAGVFCQDGAKKK
jgi:hypothetical protein